MESLCISSHFSPTPGPAEHTTQIPQPEYVLRLDPIWLLGGFKQANLWQAGQPLGVVKQILLFLPS